MRTIRSLIGRYDFGREIEAEPMVNIINPNQDAKGPMADAAGSRVHKGFRG